MSWTSGAAKPVAMSMNDYRRLSDFDLKALEGKSDSTLGRKSVGEAEGLMMSEAGDDSGVGGVQLLPAKDVLQKVVAASAAGDSQELHKWEGRLDELLEGQTEAMCAFILGAFGRVHEPAKDATGTMDAAMPPQPPPSSVVTGGGPSQDPATERGAAHGEQLEGEGDSSRQGGAPAKPATGLPQVRA